MGNKEIKSKKSKLYELLENSNIKDLINYIGENQEELNQKDIYG